MDKKLSPQFDVTVANRRLRSTSLAYGLVLFVWLNPEDNAVWPVALLGVGLALLIVMWMVWRWFGNKALSARDVAIGAALLGGITGLGGALSSAGLMFFKNALHAHVFWDYPPAMIMAMLTRAPTWALAGGLVGIGAAILWIRHRMIGMLAGKVH